jgi:uncharacterized membrane protein YjgN (DUF898 family)
MDQNQTTPLFGLSVDATSKKFLSETARWASFLAVIGFIVCALVVIGGIVVAIAASQFDSAFDSYNSGSSIRMSGSGFGAVLGVVYILFAVLYFFPCLYLLRFSNHMKVAIAAEDQTRLTTAFENLKSVFKFMGILTIIILSLYVLGFLFGGLAAAFS